MTQAFEIYTPYAHGAAALLKLVADLQVVELINVSGLASENARRQQTTSPWREIREWVEAHAKEGAEWSRGQPR